MKGPIVFKADDSTPHQSLFKQTNTDNNAESHLICDKSKKLENKRLVLECLTDMVSHICL